MTNFLIPNSKFQCQIIFFLEFLLWDLEFKNNVYICTHLLKQLLFLNPAGVAKLVDVPDLGSGAARRVGSSPITRTKLNRKIGLFLCKYKKTPY